MPRGPDASQTQGKAEENKSLSQTQFSNPFGAGDIVEQFEPTWVKLDKQVCFCVTSLFDVGSKPSKQKRRNYLSW